MQPNLTCNLRCQHCQMWRITDPTRMADRMAPLRLHAVREFAELNPQGTVDTSGGEPLMEPSHYFELCRSARELGLHSISVMNGTLIDTQEQADDLLTRGADLIALSLDHPREEIHDMMRGKQGSWKKTTKCLRMLVDARKRLRLPRKLHVVLMVYNDNYQQLDDAYDLVLHQIGADKLKLNFLLPTLSKFTKIDSFWNLHSRNINPDILMGIIGHCESKYNLNFNPEWKADVRCYAESLARHHQGEPLQTTRQLCNSCDRNLVLEFGGMMRLCPFPKFPSQPYREPGDMKRYWRSPETEKLRSEMRQCRDICGICHAYRRNSATLETTSHPG